MRLDHEDPLRTEQRRNVVDTRAQMSVGVAAVLLKVDDDHGGSREPLQDVGRRMDVSRKPVGTR